MEKDSVLYCYDTYSTNTNNLPKNNKTTTTTTKKNDNCKYFGSGSGNNNNNNKKCHQSKTKLFLTGLATNLGICILLFGYTLIGSVIFLAIEGGNIQQPQQHLQHSTQILATTSMNNNSNKNNNLTKIIKKKNDEARAKTVENIWDITVSLNILYRDNWTKLAAQEIDKFQNELLKSLNEEIYQKQLQQQQFIISDKRNNSKFIMEHYEWTFARAFLYSLTVLTTIGYGSIAPKTTLGKAVTMVYAMIGIPLTLLYLSSIGSVLSRIARGVFSRALCCCLCSNCGYCCYDEKRMEEKERRMKKKRQEMEMQQQQQQQHNIEPFYVRSNDLHSPLKDIDNLSLDEESKMSSVNGLSILAPILLCLIIMFLYICLGTFVLYKLENWSVLDGFYFCFMSLTTIGFGDLIPGEEFYKTTTTTTTTTTIWFCSFYIMSGMALTAMCFNVVHDEIVHRLKHQTRKINKKLNSSISFTTNDDIQPDPYIS